MNDTINQLPSTTLAPRTLTEAMEFSKLVSQSAIVPKDYQGKPANVLVAVQWGMELGLAPMQAMQNIAVINGRPSIWGDAMLALCQAHPEFEDIYEESTDDGATCTVKRRGRSPVTCTFTKEDAKRAGLAGKQGPWTQYPRRMMQLRARSFALRDAFADALKGMRMAEEVRDMPAERDMGAADVVVNDEPRSGVAAVKAKLASKQEAPAEAVDTDTGEVLELSGGPPLDVVLAAFDSATTMDELTEAADYARHLADEDKAKARAAYEANKTRLAGDLT